MTQLANLLALPSEMVIAGQTYRLGPLRLADYAELEQAVLARRPHPLDAVRPRLAGLAEPLQRHLLGLAYDDARRAWQVSLPDLQAWLHTFEGGALRFWLLLRPHHPELSPDDAARLWQLAAQSEAPR